MRINQFIINLYGFTVIWMPIHSTILSVQWSNNIIILFALVDDRLPVEPREFRAHITDQSQPVDLKDLIGYVATIHTPNDGYFTHIFEYKPKEL
jgi:hypothetical protein